MDGCSAVISAGKQPQHRIDRKGPPAFIERSVGSCMCCVQGMPCVQAAVGVGTVLIRDFGIAYTRGEVLYVNQHLYMDTFSGLYLHAAAKHTHIPIATHSILIITLLLCNPYVCRLVVPWSIGTSFLFESKTAPNAQAHAHTGANATASPPYVPYNAPMPLRANKCAIRAREKLWQPWYTFCRSVRVFQPMNGTAIWRHP